MKLSEAIMLNGVSKPQGRGACSMYSVDAPCALGGAAQSIGRIQSYSSLLLEWPFGTQEQYCPVCCYSSQMFSVIAHLNDQHEWSRAQIAEYVASVEPQESVTSSADEMGISSDEAKTADGVRLPGPASVPSADSYSVSEHAFAHSEHVMGRGNING